MQRRRSFWTNMKAQVPSPLRPLMNKFVITVLLFGIWMLLFEKYSISAQYQLENTLIELEQEKVYFEEQIKIEKATMHELFTNKDNLEKYSRERYLMKKPNEDIFIIDYKE